MSQPSDINKRYKLYQQTNINKRYKLYHFINYSESKFYTLKCITQAKAIVFESITSHFPYLRK